MRTRNRYLRDCLLKICSAKILQRVTILWSIVFYDLALAIQRLR
jgi:hypothetical protein